MVSSDATPLTPEKKQKVRKWTRRRFFKGVGKITLFGGLVTTIRVSGYPKPPKNYTLRVFTATDYHIMEAIVIRIVEAQPEDPDPKILKSIQAIDHYLANFPRFLVWQIRLLLRLVEHTPLFFHGYLRRFTNLDAASQTNVLKGWENSFLTAKRQGFKALKTMAYLSYYRHEDTWKAIAYEGPLVPKGYRGGEKGMPYDKLKAPPKSLPKGIQ